MPQQNGVLFPFVTKSARPAQLAAAHRGLLPLVALLFLYTLAPSSVFAQDALLVVAHGAPRGPWNDRVRKIVEKVTWPEAVGVAFLMPATPEEGLEAVVERLDRPGIQRILVVPLMVSSHSEHIEELKFLVGMPAQMSSHGDHTLKPLATKARLVLAPAMDGDALITQILADQIRPLIQNAPQESLVLVGHGPNNENWNDTWLQHLQMHAGRLGKEFGFHAVQAVTLRDDAPKEVRDAATQKLRDVVSAQSSQGAVLVLPVLVSVGKIQQEIRERLSGLSYRMTDGGIAEHALTAQWIQQQAAETLRKVSAGSAPGTR